MLNNAVDKARKTTESWSPTMGSLPRDSPLEAMYIVCSDKATIRKGLRNILNRYKGMGRKAMMDVF